MRENRMVHVANCLSDYLDYYYVRLLESSMGRVYIRLPMGLGVAYIYVTRCEGVKMDVRRECI